MLSKPLAYVMKNQFLENCQMILRLIRKKNIFSYCGITDEYPSQKGDR